jgi:hypothetical protein
LVQYFGRCRLHRELGWVCHPYRMRRVIAAALHTTLPSVRRLSRNENLDRAIGAENDGRYLLGRLSVVIGDGMKQPLKMARRLGLLAVSVSCGFIVVPLIIFTIAVLHEISECVCPAPPLADGLWFALVFSLVGFIGSLMAVSKPTDSAVFMSASGIGLFATGAVIVDHRRNSVPG